LSATSQQYFSLRTNVTSYHQPTSSTFLSKQISTSHQPNEQAASQFYRAFASFGQKTVATLFTGADFLSPLFFSLSQPKEEPQILAPPIPASLPL
jgi:hypothetical protein